VSKVFNMARESGRKPSDPEERNHHLRMRGDLLNSLEPRSDSNLEEDYFLSTLNDEDLEYKKREKAVQNRCSYILQSLEGKSIHIAALNVDIVNSSEKVKGLSHEVAGGYYQAFLENASDLIDYYGGYVLKNVGDCVIAFFPCSKYFTENHDKAVLCGLAMRDMINNNLNPYFLERKLPSIECRVSADFGAAKVIRIRSNGDYSSTDLFGDVMNSAAKISHYAKPSQMVIGDNLFWKLIDSNMFEFKLIHRWDLIGKKTYPVFLVTGSKKRGESHE